VTSSSTQPSSARRRLLVFIPAFEAARHIEWVLGRLPDVSDAFDAHVLVIDDASGDGTATIATRYLERTPPPGYTWQVLANPRNQGYGGNQKLGYRFAVENKFDVVVMVHGDGQYPPEMIAPLAEAALQHGAAFGSRMANPQAALDGGMPRYKFVGNRILTRVQNKLLGTELTEFHSGFRAYTTETLRSIPFDLNSTDFHFDTEIFIQCLRAGIEIGEIPIPTHYGDEVCRVNGMKYARNVVGQTLRSRLHDMGLMYERKYGLENRAHIYASKLTFASPATAAQDRVPPGSTVLDLGSSTGHLAKALRRRGCRVIGVDLESSVDADAFDEFIVWNLDQGLPPVEGPVDTVLLLDVVEHLRSPEDFVEALARFCHEHGVRQVLVSTGNVAFLVQRLMLLMGQFNYGPRGILDMTHTRLFTQRTIERLFKQARFDVLESFGLPVPVALAVNEGGAARTLLRMNETAIRARERVFSYQFFLSLRPPVDLDDLIDQSMAHARALAKVDVGPS
jgi:glycosyltransferase involved in cell wall biosynthesis